MEAYIEMPEEKVVSMAQSGDELAIEHLIRSYKGFINYITQGYYLKDGDYQDLQQEATIGLLEAIQSYNDCANIKFRNFAYLCIKREVDSLISRSNRKKRQILNNAIPIYAFTEEEKEKSGKNISYIDKYFQCQVPTPEGFFLEREGLEELNDFLLNQLSSLEKKVLTLRLSGLSYRDITLILSISDKSVDNAMQRIKRKINAGYFSNRTA